MCKPISIILPSITKIWLFFPVCYCSGEEGQYNLSRRLGMRKALFEKRKRISDYALIMGMFGILVMIAENELEAAGVYRKVSSKQISLRFNKGPSLKIVTLTRILQN